VLSIQSWVAYGHVGNAAAVLPLQLLGHEVWAAHTVQFSNHPGYGAWRGRVFDAAHVAEVIAGIAERGLFARCDAVLSGYLGDAATGMVVLDAVAKVRAANPGMLFCCDPVMGDDGPGLFVRPGVAEFFAESAASVADVLTPNRFELERLTQMPVRRLGEVLDAVRSLLARGTKMILVTGLVEPMAEPGLVGTILVSREGAWLASNPRLAIDPPPNGTGDTLAALFLGNLLARPEPDRALTMAVSGLFAVLEAAAAQRLRELPLVAAQKAMIDPPVVFSARRIQP